MLFPNQDWEIVIKIRLQSDGIFFFEKCDCGRDAIAKTSEIFFCLSTNAQAEILNLTKKQDQGDGAIIKNKK